MDLSFPLIHTLTVMSPLYAAIFLHIPHPT